MVNHESDNFFIQPEDYQNAIKQRDEFFIQFQRFTSEIDYLLIKIIHRYLDEHDLLYHKDTIISIVKEFINNAIKANLKRLYFESRGLDINNTRSYREGMEKFKEDVFHETESAMINTLIGSNYNVRVKFAFKIDKLAITVINNIPILDAELSKIKARASKAYRYKDMVEAFTDVLDDSEGAGLGLIMSLMLLKNSGFPRNSFSISRSENMTQMNLHIPLNRMAPEINYRVTEEILKEIKDIPALPANINEIRQLCRDPESNISDISNTISRDPGLTATIIKLANSAAYATMNKFETLDDALKIIGMKGINTLLIATGVQKIVESRYKKFENIWDNSYKRAFYTKHIISKVDNNNKLLDQVYLSALLADIGRIVMLSIEPELVEKIKKMTGFKGMIDPTLIEEISLGISHSSLGAIICKKWNFNESLVKTIELHHRPYRAPDELKNMIYTVYLADVFVEIENNKFRFEITDDDVLEFFHLTDKITFSDFHRSLKEKYDSITKIP